MEEELEVKERGGFDLNILFAYMKFSNDNNDDDDNGGGGDDDGPLSGHTSGCECYPCGLAKGKKVYPECSHHP